MTSTDRDLIAECGARAERALILANTYAQAGYFADAATCAEWAEVDSYIAFSVAARA